MMGTFAKIDWESEKDTYRDRKINTKMKENDKHREQKIEAEKKDKYINIWWNTKGWERKDNNNNNGLFIQ